MMAARKNTQIPVNEKTLEDIKKIANKLGVDFLYSEKE
jgi:hypothetical protein